MPEIELNYDLDPIERLEQEIKATDEGFNQTIGKYLLGQLKSDSVLKNCYKDRKITLDKLCEYLYETARKKLHGKNGALEDKVVFGWVLHYVQDEEVKITESETLSLTVKEKQDIEEKAKEDYYKQVQEKLESVNAKKPKKVKKEEKSSEQLSLFDF